MDYVATAGQFSIFYNIPFWVIGLGILAILLLAVEIGFRIGLCESGGIKRRMLILEAGV
jgi:hypothetical protein